MTHPALIDSVLVRLFRFRTRGFLRMDEADGAVPAAPREGGCHLYVHIPFCDALCPFCPFHRVAHVPANARRYFPALRDEIRMYHASGHRFTGVYFGGGTPTCEPAELLETIALVRGLFGIRDISVETNPRDLRPEFLARLRAAGVTRLSVGVQSFDDALLKEMGRFAQYGGGEETAEHIRGAAGIFPTLNLDLIFNLPHQTVKSLESDLAIVRNVGANQVSCYPLMNSPAAMRRMEQTMGLPDPRRRRRFYETILSRLRPDFAATSAWCFTRGGSGSDEYIVTSDNYVGVGSGAFSYLDGQLLATTFSLAEYERRISAGLTGITMRHGLGEGDRMRYALLVRMFGLGLDRRWAEARFGRRFFQRLWGELRTLELLGAAERDTRGWRLTDRGMYWLVLMMSEFFCSVNAYRDAMRARAGIATQSAALPLPLIPLPAPR